MGNDTSSSFNEQNSGQLVPQKSFHSVHNTLLTDNVKKNKNEDAKNIHLNVNKAAASVSDIDEKSDIIEISLTPLELETSTKTTKKQKEQQKWKNDLEKAINATPNTNIIGHISNIFHYRKRLAKGSSCCVLLCQHKTTKKLCVLKEMNKNSRWNPSLYITEKTILNTLKSHVNIMTYFDAYIDKKCLYIVSEYCGGGTLLDKIINMKIFTEKIAAKYITTILNVVDFIHQHAIAHRDLKPNNIVFDKPGDDGILKLIDFGDAIMIADHEKDGTFVGTLHYFTPEMIQNPMRKGWQIRKADTYCIGVIAYVLLTGCFPFHSKHRKEIKKQILKAKVVWPSHVKLSVDCKDFLLSLLNKNVEQRLNTKQALAHKWLMGHASNDDLGDNLKKYQTNFHHSNMLQRLLIDAMFSEMSTTEKKFCIQKLTEYKTKQQKDKSKSRRNSLVSEQEFVEFMITNHVDESKAKVETQKLFKHISSSKNILQNKSASTDSIGTPTIDAVDVESLLEQLILDNGFEMSTSNIDLDEFGFEKSLEPAPDVSDEKEVDGFEDLFVALSPSVDKKGKCQMLKNKKNIRYKEKCKTITKVKSMNYIEDKNKKVKEGDWVTRSQSVRLHKPSIKITNCNSQLSIEISRTLTLTKSDISNSSSKIGFDELDTEDFEEAVAFARSESIYKTSVPLSKRSITVQQFRNLLSKAPKKLDIESVIDDLDPNHVGIIDLRNITNYSREIEMED